MLLKVGAKQRNIRLCKEHFANILIFRQYASKYLKLGECVDEHIPLQEIRKKVIAEIKRIPYDSAQYTRNLDENVLLNDCSHILLDFLAKLCRSLSYTPSAYLIGSIVTSSIMKRVTP